jgi:hypothetical protein
MDCFALFFQPSVVKVANLPCSFAFNLASTFAASWSRIGPDKVRRSGTTPPGIHFWTNKCVSGLFAEFHGAWIAIKSLHRSSPNSDCVAGVHMVRPEDGELSRTLNVCLRLCDGLGLSNVGRSRGLGSGDGVAEPDGPLGHVVEIDKGG